MSWAADFQEFFVLVYGPGLSWVLAGLLAVFIVLVIVQFFVRIFLPPRGPR